MSQVTDYKDSYRPEFSLIFKVSKKKERIITTTKCRADEKEKGNKCYTCIKFYMEQRGIEVSLGHHAQE